MPNLRERYHMSSNYVRELTETPQPVFELADSTISQRDLVNMNLSQHSTSV